MQVTKDNFQEIYEDAQNFNPDELINYVFTIRVVSGIIPDMGKIGHKKYIIRYNLHSKVNGYRRIILGYNNLKKLNFAHFRVEELNYVKFIYFNNGVLFWNIIDRLKKFNDDYYVGLLFRLGIENSLCQFIMTRDEELDHRFFKLNHIRLTNLYHDLYPKDKASDVSFDV